MNNSQIKKQIQVPESQLDDDEISDEGTPSDKLNQELKNLDFNGIIKHHDGYYKQSHFCNFKKK